MFDLPSINDITTTHPNPPQFKKIAELNPQRNYKYPDTFYKKQTAYYKDLKPLSVLFSVSDTFKHLQKIAQTQANWEIIATDEKEFRIEAVATTSLLHFKDDIVIEVRAGVLPGTSTVHMRSKSRVGRGDLGANAARIKSFFKKIQH